VSEIVHLTSYAVTAEKLGMETPHAQIRPNVLIVKGTTPPTPKNAWFFLKEKNIHEIRVLEGLSFPEARKRYEERCPKLLKRSFLRLSKRALTLQRRQHLVFCRLLAPSPVPPKKVNACAQTDVAAQTEATVCSGQNCYHISLQRVLENGRINRVANDHLGAHLQEIVRIPGRVPVTRRESASDSSESMPDRGKPPAFKRKQTGKKKRSSV
jgi:hypothetical protein